MNRRIEHRDLEDTEPEDLPALCVLPISALRHGSASHTPRFMGCNARPKLEVETTHEPELGAPASLPACRGVGPETRRQGCRRSQSCDRCPNACAKAKGADEPAC